MTDNLLIRAATRTRGMSLDPVRLDLAWRKAAGLPTPTTVADVLAALDEQAEPAEVLADMVIDAASLSEEWLEQHIERHRRAEQIKTLRVQLEQTGRNITGQLHRSTAPQRYAEVRGPVTDALDRLGVLVKALPDGDAVLSPEASIDAGTTEELAEVRLLLEQIGTMLGALSFEGPSRPLTQWALALVEVPKVEPARMKRHGSPVLNPSTARDAIAEICKVTNLDLLILDLLRGRWPELSLRLVEGRAEHQKRAERVRIAHQFELLDGRG